MFSAKQSDGQIIDAYFAERGEIYFCPECRCRVILRSGSKAPYFYHAEESLKCSLFIKSQSNWINKINSCIDLIKDRNKIKWIEAINNLLENDMLSWLIGFEYSKDPIIAYLNQFSTISTKDFVLLLDVLFSVNQVIHEQEIFFLINKIEKEYKNCIIFTKPNLFKSQIPDSFITSIFSSKYVLKETKFNLYLCISSNNSLEDIINYFQYLSDDQKNNTELIFRTILKNINLDAFRVSNFIEEVKYSFTLRKSIFLNKKEIHIGDKGAGGGIIFYINPLYIEKSTEWLYLEVLNENIGNYAWVDIRIKALKTETLAKDFSINGGISNTKK